MVQLMKTFNFVSAGHRCKGIVGNSCIQEDCCVFLSYV